MGYDNYNSLGIKKFGTLIASWAFLVSAVAVVLVAAQNCSSVTEEKYLETAVMCSTYGMLLPLALPDTHLNSSIANSSCCVKARAINLTCFCDPQFALQFVDLSGHVLYGSMAITTAFCSNATFDGCNFTGNLQPVTTS